MTPDEAAAFSIGDRVEKVSGYRFPGNVTAIDTAEKEPRYVVTADHPDFAGMKHIFSPAQLKLRPDEAPAEAADVEREGKHAAAVAWRVKDFADGWIYLESCRDAHRHADPVGALIQPLFTDPQLAAMPREGHGEPCYYCGAPCDALAGDPSGWPVGLPHKEAPGVVRWHHSGCVSERLDAMPQGAVMHDDLQPLLHHLLKRVAQDYIISYSDREAARTLLRALAASPAPPQGERDWNAALESAAKIADGCGLGTHGSYVASRIRAMKDKP